MLISVVIPAFNEEGYLGETLASLNRAKAFLQGEGGPPDSTADVARALSATVENKQPFFQRKTKLRGFHLR